MTEEKNSNSTETPTPSTEAAVVEPSRRSEKESSMLVKLLAIIGLLALLGVATWISILVVRFTPETFSALTKVDVVSLFTPRSKTANALLFGSDTISVEHNRPFSLSWSRSDKSTNDVAYTLTYPCIDGFSLRGMKGVDVLPIACDTPFAFTTASDRIVLIPSIETNATTVDITVARDGASDSAATISLAFEVRKAPDTARAPVAPASTPQSERPTTVDSAPAPSTQDTSAVPVPTTPTQVPQRQSVVYVPNPKTTVREDGVADLSIAVAKTGIVKKISGVDTFIAISPIPAKERAAITFAVENIGTNVSSDRWAFTALLPLNGGDTYTYRSPRQTTLRPGDRIDFTISYDGIDTNAPVTIVITLTDIPSNDPKGNNEARVTVQVSEK